MLALLFKWVITARTRPSAVTHRLLVKVCVIQFFNVTVLGDARNCTHIITGMPNAYLFHTFTETYLKFVSGMQANTFQYKMP